MLRQHYEDTSSASWSGIRILVFCPSRQSVHYREYANEHFQSLTALSLAYSILIALSLSSICVRMSVVNPRRMSLCSNFTPSKLCPPCLVAVLHPLSNLSFISAIYQDLCTLMNGLPIHSIRSLPPYCVWQLHPALYHTSPITQGSETFGIGSIDKRSFERRLAT